jgi:hypothetical protein
MNMYSAIAFCAHLIYANLKECDIKIINKISLYAQNLK